MTATKINLSSLEKDAYRHKVPLEDGRFIPGKIDVVQSVLAYGVADEFISNSRILDIGCWSGGFSFYFERLGAEVVAIDVMDPDESGFSELKALLGSKVQFKRKTLYDLNPSDDGLFDGVFFQGVYYHLKHPILALERLNAIMRTDGILFGGGTSGDSYFKHADVCIRFDEMLPEANEVPVCFFVEDNFLGDKSNWFVPNGACLKAWLKRTGFECDKLWTKAGGAAATGEPRSNTRFVARKFSQPEPEHPY